MYRSISHIEKSFIKAAYNAFFCICLLMAGGLLFSSCDKDADLPITVSIIKITPSAYSVMFDVEYSGVSSPQTAEFGVFASFSGIPSIDNHNFVVTTEHLNPVNKKVDMKLHYLSPVTAYVVVPYVKAGDKYYYGEVVEFTTREEPVLQSGAIDLGLSVKWASCNIGASEPGECGNYYAWGEISAKTFYNLGTCLWYNISVPNIRSLGVIDRNNNLTSANDVARQTLGGSWRMPSLTEIDELLDKCLLDWYSLNGRGGSLIVGPNGNYIFLPVGGYRDNATLLKTDSEGRYWSATANQHKSRYLYISSSLTNPCECSRKYGYTIRPVTK